MNKRSSFLPMLLVCALLILLTACGNGGKTRPETTAATEAGMQKDDPRGDDSVNVLYITNSSQVYYPDELCGMLSAAGYEDINICTVYYSGCTIKRHCEWMKSGAANYELYHFTAEGLKIQEGYSLEGALRLFNWDVICMGNAQITFSSGDVEESFQNVDPYMAELLPWLQSRSPQSRFIWHQGWAPGVGYSNTSGSYVMKDIAQRTLIHQTKQGVARKVEEKYGLEVAPEGDAWELVRDLELFRTVPEGFPAQTFTLFTRLAGSGVKDDLGHDGDIGGGQYLDACVWFEVLTGESCVGNTFRPQYTFADIDCSLTEEKIELLQKAAHDAVEARK